MPGQPGSETRIRTIVLTTRWSPEEFDQLQQLARHSDWSAAEQLRWLVRQEQPMILPSKLLVNEIRRIGVNINQLARHANSGAQADHNALSDVYRDLVTATRILLR